MALGTTFKKLRRRVVHRLGQASLLVSALLLTHCIRRTAPAVPTVEENLEESPREIDCGNGACAESASAPTKSGLKKSTPDAALKARPFPIPKLVKRGDRTLLLVDNEPFFILGGELGNSSASDARYMVPIWPKLKEMHVNTVLAPVYWELVEREEGKFDFESVRWLIEQARHQDLKLVLLWFGSYKNSMSSYVPSWVKRDAKRFPRARSKEGVAQEILTPFDERNLEADRRVFSQLLAFLRDFDGIQRTVLMVQVENEIGMLPSARDYHPSATEAFSKDVPKALVEYLTRNEARLVPEVKAAWTRAGKKTSGPWESVFGKGVATDEIFMAWHFGRYVEALAQAGKKENPLPMFVNAALNRPGVLPGDYPSAGPLPHLMDIWKAAAPSIDLLVPDFYNPDFKKWNDAYTKQGDALFVPEIRFDESVGAKAFYALGHYDCLGFSPFSIESTDAPGETTLARAYRVLEQILPEVGRRERRDVEGVWLTKEAPEMAFEMDGYRFVARHDLTLGWSDDAKKDEWPHAGALVVRVSPETFFVAGMGVVITFESVNAGEHAGIDEIYEGTFVEGKWTPGRSMNGDQSHQGRHLRIPSGEAGIQRLRLYKYQ